MKAHITLFLFTIFLFAIPTATLAQEKVTPQKGEGVSALLRRHGLTSKEAKESFLEINKDKLGKDGGLVMGVTYVLPAPPDSISPTDKIVTATIKSDTIKSDTIKSDTAQVKTDTLTSASDTSANKTSTLDAKALEKATTPTEQTTPAKTATKPKGKIKKESLFGTELQNVTISSNELNGACFYLVSGHGGPDPGAISRVGGVELHEDEYAYDITLRLARRLMEHGAKVHIIIQDKKDGIRNDKYLSNSKRETCMGKAIPLNHTKRLKQRCDVINRQYRKDKERYKRAIFVHVDSRRRKEQIDVFLYHAPGSTQGKRLASNIWKTIESKYKQHQPGRGFTGTVSGRGLYVLRQTSPIAAFLELGNMQNEKDRKRLIIPNNRQALANWICQGIIKDYKASK